MYIQKISYSNPINFSMNVSKNSSSDFKFFSENFIQGGYLKVINSLFFIKKSENDTITFSDVNDFIVSSNTNYSPYFFYNFNNDEKKYKLTFPPIRKMFSVKFPVDEIKEAFADYNSRR